MALVLEAESTSFKEEAAGAVPVSPRWYHSRKLWLLGSFSIMGVVYGTAFLTIGILSRNLAVVAFALVVYFAAFLIVLSTWYVRNVMFQDSLFVKMRFYNADGRFLIEMLGKDPKVVREAQPISPGERIDPQKLGIVRFSSTEITKLRVPWECIALILAKHVIAAWLFVKLAFPSVTS